MAYKNFDEVIHTAKMKKKRKSCAVVWVNSKQTVEAVLSAWRDGIIEPLLIGDVSRIQAAIEEIGGHIEAMEIIPVQSPEEAAQKAVELVHCGRADTLMKGQLETSVLMHEVLNKKHGLRTEKIISIFGLYEIPTYHKLLGATDTGINVYPNLRQKKLIIENAVQALRGLGVPCPKVAVLAALEKVNPKMRETVEARALREMNERGEIKDCIVEGPISYDLALSEEGADVKGFKSPVMGDADLLMFPDLTSGNLTAKALVRSGGAKAGGCILGAKVPIMLPSRSSPVDEIYRSIVFTSAVD
jgi:phosphate butyryltransferase